MIGKLLLGFRALLTSITRVVCIVAFFTPFLGLMDILSHWVAEQVALDLRFRDELYKTYGPIDIEKNMFSYYHREAMQTVSVPFSALYSDPTNPPGYQEYTLVTLGVSWITFCVLLGVQFVSIMLIKIKFSGKFKEANLFKKLLHTVEKLNFPDCYSDWDEGEGSLEQHRERYWAVKKEMVAMVILHFLSNLVMLCPIVITGQCSVVLRLPET